jgi:hypothetical protein
MEQFEALAIGSTPGQPEVDVAALPRPCGAQQQQAYAPTPGMDQANCSPINMRMSVNAIPSTTALKARWPLPVGLIVQPMADDAVGNVVPLVPLGSAGGRAPVGGGRGPPQPCQRGLWAAQRVRRRSAPEATDPLPLASWVAVVGSGAAGSLAAARAARMLAGRAGCA